MKLHLVALIGFLGISTLPIAVSLPVYACTPAPDNPDGCDGINGGRPRIPVPVCTNCPPEVFRLKDRSLIIPAERMNRPVLSNKERLLDQKPVTEQNQGLHQPQLGTPYHR